LDRHWVSRQVTDLENHRNKKGDFDCSEALTDFLMALK
jgi:hypothetical protein